VQRVRPILAIAAALVLAVAATSSAVVAQDGRGARDHPILGSWMVDATPTVADDAPELVSFHAEGSVRSVGSQGPTVGTWERTGRRSADVTVAAPFSDPQTGAFMGFGWFRGSLEVSQDGQSFTGTYTLEPPAVLAQALGIPEGQLGPSELSGERIPVEPMGEAVAPIPQLLIEGPPGPGASPAPGASPMAPEASPAA
jgi:hypothetical protein